MIELSADEYPVLSQVNQPTDLRKFSLEELEQLCADMRKFLIQNLADNPGHFASSMGAVELTVALHYVYNTPFDRLVWDVGHQAYGHKLLTGRAKQFDTNRKLNGLSGFPNPEESEYDSFIAGHASNSISAALGMSAASKLKGEDPRRRVVAIIGDASIGGGLAFEGINNAANSAGNILIILNDNDMSIDSNVGSLNSYLTKINTSKYYNDLRYKAYNGLRKYNLINDKWRHSILRFNNSVKALLAREQNIFEGLNIRYFGPFDGHDLEGMIRVLTEIKNMEGPKLLHLRTVKGKGYAPAEQDPATWHAPGKFNPDTGEIIASKDNGCKKYQDVFGETLVELAKENPNIVGITAAMPSGTSMNKLQEVFPERMFDVGISEGHAVTFAGGLAKDGLLPYCAIYSSFLQRGYDHIIHDVAIQHLPVTFCIDRAGLVGEDGVTHHGLFDIAYMRNIPGMTVAVPRNEHILRNLLYTSQAQPDGPMAIRYPRGKGNMTDWHNEMQLQPKGKGELLFNSSSTPDAVILAVGPIAEVAVNVAKSLQEDGIHVNVYDMIFVKPLDEEILTSVANLNVPIVSVEDGIKAGGFGSAISEWMNDHDFARIVKVLGVPDNFIAQGTPAEQHQIAGIDYDSIKKAVCDVVTKSKQQ